MRQDEDPFLAVSPPRRRFLTTTVITAGVVGTGWALSLLRACGPQARSPTVQSPVVVNLSQLPEGQQQVVKWHKRVVWILRRSPAMIAALAGLQQRLKDPQSLRRQQQPDYVLKVPHWRSIRPEFCVLVGRCTHLGCIPQLQLPAAPGASDSHWPGGYVCPCHQSRFDLAGRVFKEGPAPENLFVPPHHYQDAQTLVIGVPPPGQS